jgi:hypothetical protein
MAGTDFGTSMPVKSGEESIPSLQRTGVEGGKLLAMAQRQAEAAAAGR